jgi:hypothetical protein
VSTGCVSAGKVSVVQEPLGFPATGNVPDPPSLDVPLETPESPEPLPELPPLDDPLEVLAPSEDSPPSSPAPEPLPELDCDEPPSFWPEALFALEEPVLPLHPIPSAKERDNQSTTRSARIVVLPSKRLV